MTHFIKSIIELEELINNREYIDNLTIDVNEDINHLLCNLTDLTHLEFVYDYNQQTDLSLLSNLTCLKFGLYYDQVTNLSTLSNLQHLEFGYCYEQLTDLSQCKKLKKLNYSNIEELDLSTYLNGIFKKN